MGRTILLLLATAIVATACDSPVGIGPVEQQVLLQRLKHAQLRWSREGLASYVLTLRRICYCSEVEPRRITVVDGEVTDVRIAGAAESLPADQWRWYPSVEGLFTIVREAIDQPAHQLEVTYAADRGHPIRVAIDWDQMVADEEVTYEVLALEHLVTSLADARR